MRKRCDNEPRDPIVQLQDPLHSGRFLTFLVGGQRFALRSEDVLEVIRMPAVARVPQGPPALLGIGNLRGAVLPIAGLRQLLGKSPATDSSNARAIVLDIGAPIAVAVDAVVALEYVTAEQIDTGPKDVGASGAERLLGVLAIPSDKEVAKILDIKAMLEAAFSSRSRTPRRDIKSSATAAVREQAPEAAAEILVTFDVAGQEFALPLVDVEEIIPAPTSVTALPHSEALILGLAAVRDMLLPLLSLRALLGFPATQTQPDREKVLVVRVGGARVGLVADRAVAVLAADGRLLDPVPPALAARTGGESRIRAVYRGEAGRRLISILSSQQLFRDEVMQKLAAERTHSGHDEAAAPLAAEELSFLVFRLGDDEFGLPIDAVVEVARVPEQITRLPRTPKFLEGVVNLRGEIVPVIDQRRRFDMAPLEQQLEGRRLIVIRTERHRAGVIVDGVSDVLRSSAQAIEPAPELTDETSRLVRGLINLPASNRIVLLLDPMELLTRAEHGLLDKFEARRQRTDA